MLGSSVTGVDGQTCKVWDGGAGTDRWHDAANWSSDTVPLPSDCVHIPAGNEVLIDAPASIQSITVYSPGKLTIGPTGSLTLLSPGSSEIYVPVFNDGLLFVDGLTGTLSLFGGGGGSGDLGAEGKDRLRFGGGFQRIYTLEDGARLLGGVTVGIPDRIPSGVGDCEAPEGGYCPEATRIDVAADAVALAEEENTLYASVLGGPGTLSVLGVLNWTSDPFGAAEMRGPGRTIVEDGAELRINGELAPGGCGIYLCGGVNFTEERSIQNHGLTSISNGGFIAADHGTTFINEGEFDIGNDRGYYEGKPRAGSGESFFHNLGTVRKSAGPGDSLIVADFHNDGDVDVVSGTLRVWTPRVEGTVGTNKTLATGTTLALDTPTGRPVIPLEYATAVENLGAEARISIEQVPNEAPPEDYGSVAPLSSVIDAPSPTDTRTHIEIDSTLVEGIDSPQDSVVVLDGFQPVLNCPPGAGTPGIPCISRRRLIQGDVRIVVVAGAVGSGGRGPLRLSTVLPSSQNVQVQSGFNPSNPAVLQSGSLVFEFVQGSGRHRVKVNPGQCDSGRKRGGTAMCTLHSSGRFKVVDVPKKKRAAVRVGLRVQSYGNIVRVQWTASRCSQCSYTVQVKKRKGKWGRWSTWRSGSTASSGDFKAGRKLKEVRFRSRTQRGKQRSGWSQVATVRT